MLRRAFHNTVTASGGGAVMVHNPMILMLPLRTSPLGAAVPQSVGSAAQTNASQSPSKGSAVSTYRLPGNLGECKSNLGDCFGIRNTHMRERSAHSKVNELQMMPTPPA